MAINLTAAQINQILCNIHRKCAECGTIQDPRSTVCIDRKCGSTTKFPFVIISSYYEHYELKKCSIHDTQITYCIHPSVDSELQDLITYCTQCLKEDLEEKIK